MKWKKRREAAVLAAVVLLCGGMYSVQAEDEGTEGIYTIENATIPNLTVDNAETVILNNSTLSGGSISAQDSSTITMNGGTADVDNVVLEGGSTITFKQDTDGKGAVVTAGSITASGTKNNTLNIQGGSQVTAGALTATNSTISITGNDSTLILNGDAVLSGTSKVTMSDEAKAIFNGNVNVNDQSSIAITSSASVTFSAGSHLYANSNGPAISLTNNASLKFEAGSSVHINATKTAEGKYKVNTVVKGDPNFPSVQAQVDEDAALFIQNLESNGKYDLSNIFSNMSPSIQWGEKYTGRVSSRSFKLMVQ